CSLVTPSMLWTVLACCCTAATSCASSSVCWAQPHSHSTRFCIPHLLERSTRVPKIMTGGVWQMFGDPTLRIYLAGEVAIERGEQLLREADLPGRQGRLALVYLVMERERAPSGGGSPGCEPTAGGLWAGADRRHHRAAAVPRRGGLTLDR